MELMIVLILMAVITALAVPKISESVANNKVSEAATGTLVVFRAARSEAAVSMRAMRVFIDRNAPTQLVRLDRSSSNLCANLPDCTTTPPDFGGNPGCGVRWADFARGEFTRRGVRIRDIVVDGVANQTSVSLCVVPSGRVFKTAAGLDLLGTEVQVLFDRTAVDGTTSMGVVRRVIVSTSGMPRLML
jgi:type II secretory pathway pseudopilin PulG